MSLVADVLQPLSAVGLTYVRGPTATITLSDLLMMPRRAGYDFDFDAATQAVLLGFREPALVTNALAADCRRMAGGLLPENSAKLR